jgi:surface antigen
MYVSDAWINTGGDTATMVPACSHLPADPSGYPWPSVSETGTDPVDGYGYQQGQCTSFAAWEIRSDRLPHTKSPDGMGNAYSWTGLTSTSTPHVGEVAQWDPNVHGAGYNGHVAYVAAVYPDTNTILVYEYNWTDAFDNNQYLRLSERTVYLNHTDYTGPPSRYLKF